MHFDDVHVVTFNCALCDFVAHLTFQLRKVFVTKSFKLNYVLCQGHGQLSTTLKLERLAFAWKWSACPDIILQDSS